MDVNEWLGAGRRAVLERLRGLRSSGESARRSQIEVDAGVELAAVHLEHVAELLTVLLRARLDGEPRPEEVSLEAVAALGSAVERWGLAAEVALLVSEPCHDTNRKLADAIMELSPTPDRRVLSERVVGVA